MRKSNLENLYFEWVYNLVCNDKYYKRLSYRQLLYFLYDTDFYYVLERDSNRASDGIGLRYRFGYECGYPREIIDQELGEKPCSVLEVMVSLALNIEEDIMDDPTYGNRLGQWFWGMIVNLGLGSMDDEKFDPGYVEYVIYRFLNREYKKNGEGGLFTVHDIKVDMRKAELWYQAMWYLDEFLKE